MALGTDARNRWATLKEEYFETILAGKHITLAALAEKYGVAAQSVRNKSSKEKWPEAIEKIRQEREKLLTEKLAERTTLALDQLNQEFATNEAEIRKRHALMARGLQVRAVKRLKEIPLEQFSPRDALFMLKLGIEEERRAIGLPDSYVPPPEADSNAEYRTVAEQVGGHKKVQALGLKLLAALRQQVVDADIEEEVMGPKNEG